MSDNTRIFHLCLLTKHLNKFPFYTIGNTGHKMKNFFFELANWPFCRTKSNVVFRLQDVTVVVLKVFETRTFLFITSLRNPCVQEIYVHGKLRISYCSEISNILKLQPTKRRRSCSGVVLTENCTYCEQFSCNWYVLKINTFVCE